MKSIPGLRGLAVGADAGENHLTAHLAVAGFREVGRFRHVQIQIINSAAILALNMLVLLIFTVITRLGPMAFQLADLAILHQHIQIAVYRPQAHPGQTPPHDHKQLIGRGMVLKTTQLLQNYTALRRHALLCAILLVLLHLLIGTVTIKLLFQGYDFFYKAIQPTGFIDFGNALISWSG